MSGLIATVLGSAAALADPPRPAPIFDGRSLSGWDGNPQVWRVEDEAITAEIPAGASLAKNEFIYWRGEVHDFELTLEFKITGGPSANSGIQFRSQRDANGHAEGYQADLDAGTTWLGRIYDEHGRELLVERGTRVSIAPDGRKWVDPFAKADDFGTRFKADAWNTYRILAAGPHVEVWINGVLFCAFDDHEVGAAEYSGLLALQLHSGRGPAKVQFRNLRLAHLGRTQFPTTPPPTAHTEVTPGIAPAGPGGTPLNLGFETGTLAGWTGKGDAFAGQPLQIKADDPPAVHPTKHVGKFWVGYNRDVGNKPTGELTSAPFEATHRWASFLVAGGSDSSVRVEIVEAASGRVLKSASGADVETLRREAVDLEAVVGKQIFIRLIDEAPGDWGYIAFDDFVFHAEKPVYQKVHGGDAERPQRSPVLWHLRPNPAAPTKVANAEAQQLVAGMLLASGFEAELVAAEPDVHQPIAFAIDERGRLWVAEAHSYPNKRPIGQGKDRVVIFEDRDGDGAFETRKVFVEGLNLVSGIEVGFGGVWIGAAPELLFIPDRNADDRPDGPARVLLDGWGYQDTHETLNSFSWGPDGWLYGNQGVFTKSLVGKPGTPASERHALRAGVWRYHPVRHEFEIFAHGGSNQWGIDFNEDGHLFLTHCRSFHGGGGTTYAIRNGHFWNQTNSDYPAFISNSAPDFAPRLKNFLPAAARYDSGEGGAGKPGTTAVYGGHSHVGTMIYLGDNWPDIYRNHLFTHNLHGHQLNHQVNVRQGSAYETFHGGHDLLYSSDPTYIPVDLQTGPDGAVYVIDWCDHQHCHTPHDERWDRTNGRIYRIAWAETFRPVLVNLSARSDAELAALHTHKNEWFVRTARRLLQERAAQGQLAPEAVAALREQMTTAAETTGTLRAAWTLHVVNALGRAGLEVMLRHPADVVRAWAVQLATEKANEPQLAADALVALAQRDPSSMVRLALASAMPMLPVETRWSVGQALASHGDDAEDRFLPRMVWFGLAPIVMQDLERAFAVADEGEMPSVRDSLHWFVARSEKGRERIAARLATAAMDDAARALRLLAFALQSEATLPMPAEWRRVYDRFASHTDPAVRSAAEQLSACFGDERMLTELRNRLADESLSVAERRRAFDVLKRVGDPRAIPLYVRLLEHDEFRSRVIPLLSGTDDPAAAQGILRRFQQLGAADRSAALNTLTSRPALAWELLEAVQRGALEKKHLTALHLRQMRNLGDARIDRRLDAVWGRVGESSAEAKQKIAHWKKTYSAAPLWAFSRRSGEQIFERLCAACHATDGQAGKLGPDLAGSWRNGVDYFLESIIDPNAVIGADFQLNVITLKDGRVVSGMIEQQTETALVVRTTTDTVNVPLNQIERRQTLEQSLMPAGLLETLSERETIELLKFLSTER